MRLPVVLFSTVTALLFLMGTDLRAESIEGAVQMVQDMNEQVEMGTLALQPACGQDARPAGSKTACSPTSELEACKKNGKPLRCDKSVMDKKVRGRFHQFIIEAVNAQNEINRAQGKFEIHPATLLSFIGAESSGDPLQERSDGGKGLGQFTFPDLALKYGLDYDAPKPTSIQEALALTRPNRKGPDGQPLYSVWSPKGAILAMARKLSDKLNEDRFVNLTDAKGNRIQREASVIYKGSDLLSTRYMASVYNRGNMVFNSIQEYYRRKGVLPEKLEFGLDYGAVWEVPRGEGTPPARKDGSGFQILFKECINRCHVERIAGLCGTEPQGFFAEYSKDYRKDQGQWSLSV